MKFPTIELVDRYAIAVVKFEKTQGENQTELEFYKEQIQNIGIPGNHELISELIAHHRYIWNLEDNFKKSRIDELPMEEIGRQALHIRDMGHIRAKLKNDLAELVNDPVREIKKDHITQIPDQ
jgi:hypothetical protein